MDKIIDIVSKNGVLLLNISPKADGTIPAVQRTSLLALGAWLEKNGEAIYSTRPWIEAAEGPTAEPGGGYSDHKKFLALEYTAKDIRYTASKDGKTVYAILLGVPEAGSQVELESFAGLDAKVKSVSLVSGVPTQWKQTGDGLEINVPAAVKDCVEATVFRISLF